VAIVVNGAEYPLPDDPRVSLLDHLRENIGLTGTKSGCNQGACGACTVIVDGIRVLSCLMLAVQADGCQVRTIEGLSSEEGLALEDGALHPLQRAFIEHDGLQCGYCTPGHICSAIAMVEELQRGEPSYVTANLSEGPNGAMRQEIRERMSGNLCRCGAHNGIVDAIEEMLGGDAA
jgi:xanthine dehydrogenase YagT iron-sulfur-binding subunit